MKQVKHNSEERKPRFQNLPRIFNSKTAASQSRLPNYKEHDVMLDFRLESANA